MTTHATVDHRRSTPANEITAILRERIGYHEHRNATGIAEAIVSGSHPGAAAMCCTCPPANRKPASIRCNAAIRADHNGRNRKHQCEK